MDTSTHSQTDPPTLGQHNGYPIYVMPTFISISATDLSKTVRFFTEVLDFSVMFEGPEVAGVPVLVHLRRARYQDVLIRQGKGASPSQSLVVTFSAMDARTIDSIAHHVTTAREIVVNPPAKTLWNTYELTVADPDGHRITFTAPSADAMTRGLDQTMRDISK